MDRGKKKKKRGGDVLGMGCVWLVVCGESRSYEGKSIKKKKEKGKRGGKKKGGLMKRLGPVVWALLLSVTMRTQPACDRGRKRGGEVCANKRPSLRASCITRRTFLSSFREKKGGAERIASSAPILDQLFYEREEEKGKIKRWGREASVWNLPYSLLSNRF